MIKEGIEQTLIDYITQKKLTYNGLETDIWDDLRWDEYHIIQMVEWLEARYRITIEVDIVLDLETIGDWVNYLNEELWAYQSGV
jgi:acyl carrier protein